MTTTHAPADNGLLWLTAVMMAGPTGNRAAEIGFAEVIVSQVLPPDV